VRDREITNRKLAEGKVVIEGRNIPWELNRQGRVKFIIKDPSTENLAAPGWMVFQQLIHKHSGMHRHQGGTFIYVLEGKGYSTVNGVRHDWEKDDVILLPVKSHGVVHQHINGETDKPARLLVSEANWVDVWGVDLGSGFEMLEPAPEYQA